MEYAESCPITADIEPGPDPSRMVVAIGTSAWSEKYGNLLSHGIVSGRFSEVDKPQTSRGSQASGLIPSLAQLRKMRPVIRGNRLQGSARLRPGRWRNHDAGTFSGARNRPVRKPGLRRRAHAVFPVTSFEWQTPPYITVSPLAAGSSGWASGSRRSGTKNPNGGRASPTTPPSGTANRRGDFQSPTLSSLHTHSANRRLETAAPGRKGAISNRPLPGAGEEWKDFRLQLVSSSFSPL